MKEKRLAAQGVVEYLLLLLLLAASTALALRLSGVSLREAYQKAVGAFQPTATPTEVSDATPTETPTITPTVSITKAATVTPTGFKPIATEPKPVETEPPQQKVYVSDDFQNLDQWKSIYGKNEWWVEDGWLYADSHGDQRLMNTASLPDDYAVTLEQVQLLDGQGYGIMFRLNPSGKSYAGYSFQVDTGYGHKLVFRRYDKDGSELGKPIAVGDAPVAFGWNSPHRISVSVRGDTFRAYIDGNLVLTAQDKTYPSGGVGLRTWDSARVRFSGFYVTPPLE